MALPKEPRQKMINLMYLVLTALLALNVSAEILNAFKTVNQSLLNANGTIDRKNQQLFSSLEELKNDAATKDRALMWAPRAYQAQTSAEQTINYIEGIKMELKKAAGFNPPKDTTFKEDELESTTRIMADPGTRGNELKQKLQDFKNNLLSISPEIKNQFANSLPIDLSTPHTNNKANQANWGAAYFEMVPTIAALTILSKFENDIKNSEAMVVDYCHQQVGAVKMVFNAYQPLVGQSSNYAMPGQEITITAGIGAYNTASQPQITIDGASVPLNATGIAEYKTTAGGTGSYTKTVTIKYFNQTTGQQEVKTIPVQYTVGSPTGANVSADDVKVLYIGLQNHLSVSGGTVGDEKVTAGINNGSLSKTGPGKYIAEPAKPGNATISLNVDGKPQSFEFRVKSVPDPDAMVGASGGGPMGVNEFKAQAGVRAELENFVFEGVQFTVTGFTMVFTGAGFPELQYRPVNGNRFDNVRDLIERCKPGTTITIDEIRANGPGGTRKLPPIVFNLHG